MEVWLENCVIWDSITHLTCFSYQVTENQCILLIKFLSYSHRVRFSDPICSDLIVQPSLISRLPILRPVFLYYTPQIMLNCMGKVWITGDTLDCPRLELLVFSVSCYIILGTCCVPSTCYMTINYLSLYMYLENR